MSDRCVVPVAKVRDYLLDPSHELGGPKSAFFEAHGFRREGYELLTRALVRHFEDNAPSKVLETPFGRKLIIEAKLSTPDGRQPVLRSIWIVTASGEAPSFVTAMPRKSR